MNQSKKAAASGWIGSALEYYDFFIYATAASLVFPQIFFPQGNPTVAIIASLATYGVGYVARPIGGFVLGHYGDTHGRKKVLVLCMFLMGASTMLVGLLPTYAQVGLLAPALLVVLRLVQGFAVAGEISGASSMILEHAPFGRRGFFASFTLQGVQAGQIMAAAVFLPLARYMRRRGVPVLGVADTVPAECLRHRRGLCDSPQRRRNAGLRRTGQERRVSRAPVVEALRILLARHDPRGLRGADEHRRRRGHDLRRGLRGAARLRHRLPQGRVSLDSGARQHAGRPRHPVRRQPVRSDRPAAPIIVGALGSGLLSFAYLYAISIGSVPLAIVTSLLMWGLVYQGYNAIFPSFYPEMFPARMRVSAMAIAQNVGTMITAPSCRRSSPRGAPGINVPLIVGSITFGVAVIAAVPPSRPARPIAFASKISATEMLHRFPRPNTSAFASRRSPPGADCRTTASTISASPFEVPRSLRPRQMQAIPRLSWKLPYRHGYIVGGSDAGCYGDAPPNVPGHAPRACRPGQSSSRSAAANLSYGARHGDKVAMAEWSAKRRCQHATESTQFN